MYKDSARDMSRITLNADEEEWLEFNGVQRGLPDWRIWQRDNQADSLLIEIRHVRTLTTKHRRDELRILHGGRMRRMQDEADAGKIGSVLKRIMAKSSSFSLEVLYGKNGNTTDPLEIAKTVTEFFQAWFNFDHDDDERDSDVADFSASGNEEAWAGLAERLGVPLDHAREIMEGMSDKPLADEARVEAKPSTNIFRLWRISTHT